MDERARRPGHNGVMRAVVIGAGIAGLVLARQLSLAGWSVTVREAASGTSADGFMIDFFGPGFRAAERMGIIDALAARGRGFDGIDWVDEAGRTTTHVDTSAVIASVGGKYFSILRPEIERGLLEVLPDAVDLRYDSPFSPGEPLPDADLVVGADGIHSTVRASQFGPHTHYEHHMGYYVSSFLIDDPVLASRLGGSITITDTLGAAAWLYAADEVRVGAFFVERAPRRSRPEDRRSYLEEVFGGLHPEVDRCIDRAPTSFYCDTVSQSRVPAWRNGRTVLVGDAAGAVSLLAGQGSSLAIAGAECLAEHVARAGSATRIKEGVMAYEKAWRPQVTATQAAAAATAGFFVPANRLGRSVVCFQRRLLASGTANRLLARGFA